MVHMHHIQKTRWGNPPCLSTGGCPLLGLEKKSLPGWVPCATTFWPAIKGTFWDYWETAVLGQIFAGSLLEPDFGNLPASGSGWEASGQLLENSWETAVPLRQARGGQRTPRHKRFSGKDFPSRTRRAGRRFWSL